MRRELGSVAIDATTSRRARAEVEGAPEPGATATQRTEPRRAASGLSGADASRRGSTDGSRLPARASCIM